MKNKAADLKKILDTATMKRFWSNVDKSGGEDACWKWKLSLIPGGYGQFKLEKNNNYMAHSIALIIKLGRFPKGVTIHSCDKRDCVNPSHLREGSHQENMEDMFRKGRHYSQRTEKFTEFIENLRAEDKELLYNILCKQLHKTEKPEKKERQFGSMKGLVKNIADDFDAPVEDFKKHQ